MELGATIAKNRLQCDAAHTESMQNVSSLWRIEGTLVNTGKTAVIKDFKCTADLFQILVVSGTDTALDAYSEDGLSNIANIAANLTKVVLRIL